MQSTSDSGPHVPSDDSWPHWPQALLDMCSDRVLLVESDEWRVVVANASACASLGLDAAQIVGRPLSDLSSPATTDDLSAMIAAINSGNGPTASIHLALELPDGRAADWQAHLCQLMVEGRRMLGLVSPQPRAATALSADGSSIDRRDPLTGLADRECLLRELARLLAGNREVDRHFVLLFMDVDDFKAINDRWGHLIGDEALRQVADRLARSLRSGDLLARYGGDEFAAIVHLADVDEPYAPVVQRIRQSLAEPIKLSNGELARVSVSVGVAGPPAENTPPEALLAAADRDMYRSKQSDLRPLAAAEKSTDR